MSHQLELLTSNGYEQLVARNKTFNNITKSELKGYIYLSIKSLQGEIDDGEQEVENKEKLEAIKSLIKYVARLKTALKGSWFSDDLKQFLDELRFQPDCVTALCKILGNNDVYNDLPKHLSMSPTLVKVKWKLDISLCEPSTAAMPADERSQNYLKNTAIVLFFTLSNGNTQAQRFTMTQFHQLRFVVATLLKNLIVLEQRRCVRRGQIA